MPAMHRSHAWRSSHRIRLKLAAWIALVPLFATAADTTAVFKAYMVTKDQPLFVIQVSGASSDWLPLRGEFQGYRISDFNPAGETLKLVHNGVAQDFALSTAKVTAAAVAANPATGDSNDPLRTLTGLPLAYEVARRGDENTRVILLRYQQVLGAPNTDKASQDALQFLRNQIDRLARNGAAQLLKGAATSPKAER
jgi:hypothetical protein